MYHGVYGQGSQSVYGRVHARSSGMHVQLPGCPFEAAAGLYILTYI